MRTQLISTLRVLPGMELMARRAIATIPYRFRLGPTFFEWYQRFEEAEAWSFDQVAAFRRKLLTELLQDLKEKHPYYRHQLRDWNVNDAADNLAEALPVMSRDSFRAIPSAPSLASRLSKASTSGTTGNALQFYHDADDNQREWAAICHQWRRVGYDPLKSRRAEFRGMVPPGRLVQKFPELNMLRCSILDLKPSAVRLYAEECRKNEVQFLHGYPSALDLLARTCLNEGIQFKGIRGIMLASEMVYPHQLRSIEEVFPGAHLIAHYGNAERIALGAWCETERVYHMLPLYSHVEVDSNGYLLGTNLFNRINPFIRYRMSDQVTLSEQTTCAACGRQADPLVLEIDGRAEDYLYSPVRGWIPPAIITYPLKNLKTVREIQLFQRVEDVVELRYCTDGTADGLSEVEEIAAGLGRILTGVRFELVHCDALGRGASGKLRWIVSELESGHRT